MVVDPDDSISERDETNNEAFKALTVTESDDEPPIISNVKVEEYNGDGDGFIDEGEQAKISWHLDDPSGICSVSAMVNGTSQTVVDAYYVIVGPLSEGTYNLSINAGDCIAPPNSTEYAGSFDVFEQPGIASVIPCGENDVPVNTSIKINFTTDIIPATVSNNSVILEKDNGEAIDREVDYISELRQAVITPTYSLENDQTYRVRVLSGEAEIQSENSGWWAGDEYICTFNTAVPAPEIDIRQGENSLYCNTGSYNFGDIYTGSYRSVEFTIDNQGSAELQITGTPTVSISGSHPNDYEVVQQPLSSISAGSSTTFEIRFSPNAVRSSECIRQHPK